MTTPVRGTHVSDASALFNSPHMGGNSLQRRRILKLPEIKLPKQKQEIKTTFF
jgi:hypothetical protein